MKKKKFISFKEQMKRTLIFYSLIPLVLIMFIGYCSIYFFNYLAVKKENQENNKILTKKIDLMVSEVFEKVELLSQNEKILEDIASKNITNESYQEVYDIVNKIKIKGRIIIYDKDKKPQINLEKKLDIRNIYDSLIFLRMDNNPKNVIGFTGKFYFEDGEISNYSICKALKKDNKVVGYITYYLSDEFLKEIVGRYTQNVIILVDKYNNIIMTTNENFRNGINKLDKKWQINEGYFKLDKDRYYISKNKIYYSSLSIYYISSLTYLEKSLFQNFTYLLIVLAILTFIMARIVRRVAIKKTKVMEEIILGIEKLKGGNLDNKLTINSNDEFEIIAESYNKMVDSLKELIEKNREETEHSIISEIKQLESQFNPHFLFNTLEMLRYTIQSDITKANKIILNISSILRFSIENKSSEVPISRNMFYIKNYLEIQKFRFGENFQYEIKLDESLNEMLLPKLIVQPIIENAIKYGYDQEKLFKIEIYIRKIRDNLIVAIYDNGRGMSKNELQIVREKITREKLETKEHIGLYSVQRRIKLMYGEKYKLEIRSVLGKGTFVKLILPLHRGGDNDKGISS